LTTLQSPNREYKSQVEELIRTCRELSDENESLRQQLEDSLDQELRCLDAMQADYRALEARNSALEDQNRRSQATVDAIRSELLSQKDVNDRLLSSQRAVTVPTGADRDSEPGGSDDQGEVDLEIQGLTPELVSARNRHLAAAMKILFVSIRNEYVGVAESMRQCVAEMVRLRDEKRIVRDRIGDHPILVFFERIAPLLQPTASKPD
jgi:chromosome segregation ATPase